MLYEKKFKSEIRTIAMLTKIEIMYKRNAWTVKTNQQTVLCISGKEMKLRIKEVFLCQNKVVCKKGNKWRGRVYIRTGGWMLGKSTRVYK